MAIDYVRGGNPRCPSLLVGGLMLLLLFFACSWWSLTSQNFELLNQITEMEEQLKISADELEKCTQSKLQVDERAKTLQNNAGQQRVKIEQLKSVELDLQDNLKRAQDDVSAAAKKVASLESSLTLKNTELESLKRLDEAKNKTLEALRTEKKTLNEQLLEEQTKVETLRNEISQLKNKDSVVNFLQSRQGAAGKSEQEGAGAGIAVALNHDLQAAQDENNAAEVKGDVNEPPVAPVPDNLDAREAAMAGNK